eukprot:5582991-Heterocapsa_arctica.AAC.1
MKQEEGVSVNQFLVTKLEFAMSDVFRFANAMMRCSEYLESISNHGVGKRPWERCEWNALEMMAAYKTWIRA